MKNNNAGWYWLFGILIVVLIIVIAVRAHDDAAMNAANNPMMTASSTAVTDATNVTPTEDTSAGSIDAAATAGSAPVTLSYEQALTTYANSRIQFDDICQATPNAETFVNGTDIMLDNRSPDPITVGLGSLGDVTVKGYGFKIVRLYLSGLNANAIAVDCNASQSVAIITVQK